MDALIREFSNLTDLLDDLDKEEIFGSQRNAIVERFMRDRARKTKTPYTASFELTPMCNLDCKMCYVHLDKSQMDRPLLTTEEWIGIAKQAIDAGLMFVDITGGECLTYPGFKELYVYLQTQGVKVSVLTNGSLITEEIAELFKRYPPISVQVTVYGSSGEAYKRVTGHDVFQKVVNGINLLKDAGIRTSLSITLSKFIEEDVSRLLNVVRSFGLEYRISGVTLPAREDTGRDINDFIAEPSVFLDIYQRDKIMRERNISNNEPAKYKSYRAVVKGMEIKGVPCSAGSCTFHVNWKGEMSPCISYSTVNVPIAAGGFKDAWKEITRYAESYKVPQECTECSFSDICQSCQAEKTFGYLDGKLNTAVCEKLRTYIDSGLLGDLRTQDIECN